MTLQPEPRDEKPDSDDRRVAGGVLLGKQAIELVRFFCEMNGTDSCDHGHQEELKRVHAALQSASKQGAEEVVRAVEKAESCYGVNTGEGHCNCMVLAMTAARSAAEKCGGGEITR